MSDAGPMFAGSVPENYDRYLVPLIFKPYAADLARRVAGLSPAAVLEIAAGTGAVTRELAPKLTPGTRYVATDLSQPMLDHARGQQADAGRIEWRQADAMALPFEDGAFDLVLCQFGAMFFPDRVTAYREVLRVLKPSGQFLFNVWDRLDRNEFARDVMAAIAAIFLEDRPDFFERVPHGYHDVEQIRRDLREAGFSRIAIETKAEQRHAPSVRHVALAFCHGTPLLGEIEARNPGGLDATTARVEAALAAKHGQGDISARIQAHVITAEA